LCDGYRQCTGTFKDHLRRKEINKQKKKEEEKEKSRNNKKKKPKHHLPSQKKLEKGFLNSISKPCFFERKKRERKKKKTKKHAKKTQRKGT